MSKNPLPPPLPPELRTVGQLDRYSHATTALALGVVRAAQGRDEEAEEWLRTAVGELDESEITFGLVEALHELAAFLRERGRDDEAEQLERRRRELLPTAPPEQAAAPT